ncbi:MAG: cytochrome c oxidase subunit 3 [Gammaproteobacteria bacterium]|nr:cytochrome c oxidase subunit 3 [Gammaproteobacteria bacterium]MCH9763024.1 cytochrome c oxidase subunit 3 [Gammaproteobacteria bacterium]
MGAHHSTYYIPKPSHWPLVASTALTTTLVGAGSWLHDEWYGPYLFVVGLMLLTFMLFGWFGQVIYENQRELYDLRVDRSFRWGMCWFIFSEVCFFAAFFSALFFSRYWTLPLLSGDLPLHPISHITLWPEFTANWPLLKNPDNQIFAGAYEAMGAWGLAAINTLILLTSGVTITWAHWALKLNKRRQLHIGLALTAALGLLFLSLQAYEYHEAYAQMNLTLDAGIYGTTFFMLTGFHGLHVTIGTIMLITIFVRTLYGHFTPDRHFGFEAVAWYWHFVDVVWLFLFIFVYWL